MKQPAQTGGSPPESSSLRQLVERAQRGSTEALERLVLAFRPLVRRLSRIQGRHDIDLEQELYTVFIESVKRFRPRRLTRFWSFLNEKDGTGKKTAPPE